VDLRHSWSSLELGSPVFSALAPLQCEGLPSIPAVTYPVPLFRGFHSFSLLPSPVDLVFPTVAEFSFGFFPGFPASVICAKSDQLLARGSAIRRVTFDESRFTALADEARVSVSRWLGTLFHAFFNLLARETARYQLCPAETQFKRHRYRVSPSLWTSFVS